MKRFSLFVAASVFVFFQAIAHAEVYTLDQAHTEIGFSVKHMLITNVKGSFTGFNGEFGVDGNQLTSLAATVEAESINTKIQKRDDHLRSKDFFEVEKFPEITFQAKSIHPAAGKQFVLTGILGIRDVAKEVQLTGEITDPVKDPWGNKRVGIAAAGKINRKEFGLTWNKVLESGGLLIGDEVKISLEGEGILKK